MVLTPTSRGRSSSSASQAARLARTSASDQIIVYGTVQKLSAWLGKKDNQPHGGLNVNVNGFEFGRRKNGEASGAPAGGSAGPELSEDDIPF